MITTFHLPHQTWDSWYCLWRCDMDSSPNSLIGHAFWPDKLNIRGISYSESASGGSRSFRVSMIVNWQPILQNIPPALPLKEFI